MSSVGLTIKEFVLVKGVHIYVSLLLSVLTKETNSHYGQFEREKSERKKVKRKKKMRMIIFLV